MTDHWTARARLKEYGDLMYARGVMSGHEKSDGGLLTVSNRLRMEVESAITFVPAVGSEVLVPFEEPTRETVLDTAPNLEQRLVALEVAVEAGRTPAPSEYTLVDLRDECDFNIYGDCATHRCRECEVPLFEGEHEQGRCEDCYPS